MISTRDVPPYYNIHQVTRQGAILMSTQPQTTVRKIKVAGNHVHDIFESNPADLKTIMSAIEKTCTFGQPGICSYHINGLPFMAAVLPGPSGDVVEVHEVMTKDYRNREEIRAFLESLV